MTDVIATDAPVVDDAPTVVSFPDGTTKSFGKKKLLDKDWHKDASSGQIFVDLYFKNGEMRSYGIQAKLHDNFAGHGAMQKYGDNLAGMRDIEEMVFESDELYNQLEGGEWSSKREGGGPTGTSVLARAFITYGVGTKRVSGFEHYSPADKVAAVEALEKDVEYNQTVERVKEFLRTLSQQEKTAFRDLDPVISPLVSAIEALKAKTAPKVDTASLLARF